MSEKLLLILELDVELEETHETLDARVARSVEAARAALADEAGVVVHAAVRETADAVLACFPKQG